jgi:hydrophobic/amphiphilic exporter-1 (mainly G- bacteria), HAE1 family
MADKNTQKQATATVATNKDDWNLKIARFFLDNGRVTVMAFIVFILVGMASFLGLKTTGFPSVEIKIALIRTIYPQASAQTIAEEVTTPIENAIKNISGIERYTSNSADNFSLISINIATNATKDQVVNKLTTELSSIKLPANSQKPVSKV